MTQEDRAPKAGFTEEDPVPDFVVIDVAGCMSSLSIMDNMESLQEDQE